MTTRHRSATAHHGYAVVALKTIHTGIFLGMLSSILWLLATGIAGRRDRSVAIAAAAVTGEAVVFLANDGVCPLTPLTERMGATDGSVSDIFLPDVVARTIPIWSTTLVAIAVVLHLRGVVARG
jgi:hypothetical protein